MIIIKWSVFGGRMYNPCVDFAAVPARYILYVL